MSHKFEYKNTEIGRIPKEWKVVRLGNNTVAEIRGNKTIDGFEKIAFIPMEFIPDSGVFVKYEIRAMKDVRSFTYCERGDLLLAKITPSLENGKQGIVPDNVPAGFVLATTEVFPISCNKGIDNLFLFYVLKFPKFRNKIISSMIGTTGRQRASKESVEKLQLPLPPLHEQKKIAEILSTVDQAIEKVDEAMAKTERLKKGLMQNLLTKGIGHKSFKDTEIGRVPKEWKVVKLDDISLDLIGGGTPSTSNLDYWDGDMAWMTSAHINEREIKTGQRYITKEGLQNSATSVVPKDNLLVATRVSIGKAAINKIDIAISQDLTGIVINKGKSIPDFVYWYLVNNKNRLKALAQGSTIKGILREGLRNLKLPLPFLAEQKKIAAILSTTDKRLQLLREKKERLKKVKRGLMNDLLTGKKRIGLET